MLFPPFSLCKPSKEEEEEKEEEGTDRIGASRSRLPYDGHPSIRPQPRCQLDEANGVVHGTRTVRSRIIEIEVLMHVKQQIRRRPIQVRHILQDVRRSSTSERHGASEIRSREEDHLRRRAGGPDGRDGGLHRGAPDGDVEIVRLVHEPEDDFGFVFVLGRELRPERCEHGVGWAALPDYFVVDASVVVDVDHAVGAGREADLHQVVVFAKVGLVEGVGFEVVVDEVLPRDG